MEILIKQFANKPFEVKSSNKNMRSMFALQLSMAKAEDLEDLPAQEQVARSASMLEDVINFLISTLKLSKAQQDKLDDMDFNETISIANHVLARLMGLSEADIKAAETDQKSN